MSRVQFVIVAFILLSGWIQANPLEPADARILETRVKAVVKAFDEGDVETIVEMTHPSLFRLAGGKDEMKEMTKMALNQLEETGVKIIQSELGKPTDTYLAGDELVCFYPRSSLMQVGEKKVKTLGFLICVRTIEDGQWLFLDGAGIAKNPDLLKSLLPDLQKNVKLPKTEMELIE